MDSAYKLNDRLQQHLEDYLHAVSDALERSGMDASRIQPILSDIETQVLEMLHVGSGDAPTEADILAIIARLDDPESFVQMGDLATMNERLSTPPRLAQLAAIGACWAPFFFIMIILMFTVSVKVSVGPGVPPPGPAWWQILLGWTLFPLGLTAPFGTTILGWISLTQIKHSADRLSGLGLACADILLFPVLVIDLIIVWLVHALYRAVWESWPQQVSQHDAVLTWFLGVIAVIMIFWLDYVIVKKAWKLIR